MGQYAQSVTGVRRSRRRFGSMAQTNEELMVTYNQANIDKVKGLLCVNLLHLYVLMDEDGERSLCREPFGVLMFELKPQSRT